MASIVPVELITVYVILWRVIQTYLAVLLGSYVLLRSIGQETISLDSGIRHFEKKVAVSGKET
jgi:hypothetical protein